LSNFHLPKDKHRASSQRVLDIIREKAGDRATVVLLPSDLAPGPCEAVREAAEQEYPVGEAPLTPLDRCSHPDQCGCTISVRSLDG
jgi:hypothetical protein